MGNCSDVAINFKAQYRTLDQIQKKWEIMLKDSPFRISTNPELQKNPYTSLISNTFEASFMQRKNNMLLGISSYQGDQPNNDSNQNQDQDEEKQKCCKCSNCSLRQCFRSLWSCIKGCCCFLPLLIKNSLFNKTTEKNNQQEQLDKLKNQNLVKRRLSPPWESIVDQIIFTIEDSQKNYFKLKQNHIQKIALNFGNILVIFDRFCDSYVFLSLAIHKSIQWSVVNDFYLNLSEYSIFDGQTGATLGYDYFFWFSVVCSFLYGFLSLVSLKHLRNDTLGLTSEGQEATFPHPQFFLTKIIQIIGQNLFQMMMRSFIDSFVCNWSGVRPWIMIRNDEVICFSDIHYLHICFAFLGLLIYYPFTTFIFPNFQFTQKLTDIKYEPSFLVLFQQGQLLILGATSFLRSEESDDFQMIVTLSLVIVIQVINIALIFKVWPCTVYWWNIVDIGLSLVVAIVCSGGLFIYITGQSLIGTIVTIVCICLTVLGTFIFSKKIYQKHVNNQASKISQNMPKIILSRDRNILKSQIAPLPQAKIV